MVRTDHLHTLDHLTEALLNLAIDHGRSFAFHQMVLLERRRLRCAGRRQSRRRRPHRVDRTTGDGTIGAVCVIDAMCDIRHDRWGAPTSTTSCGDRRVSRHPGTRRHRPARGVRGCQRMGRRRALPAVRSGAERRAEIASVCSGAFLLSEIGLLDGGQCTTHWARADQFAEAFPAAIVDPDPIYLHDGVWTSAGVTAGIDLALALVAMTKARPVHTRLRRGS